MSFRDFQKSIQSLRDALRDTAELEISDTEIQKLRLERSSWFDIIATNTDIVIHEMRIGTILMCNGYRYIRRTGDYTIEPLIDDCATKLNSMSVNSVLEKIGEEKKSGFWMWSILVMGLVYCGVSNLARREPELSFATISYQGDYN